MNSRRAGRQTGVFILRTTADLETIDDLARLALEVRRQAKRLVVLAAPEALVRLIEDAGLADVVGVDPSLRSERSEVGGKAEALEQ